MPLSCAPSSPISPPRWYRASPPNAPRLVARCDWFEMPKGATYIYIKNITVTFTYVRKHGILKYNMDGYVSMCVYFDRYRYIYIYIHGIYVHYFAIEKCVYARSVAAQVLFKVLASSFRNVSLSFDYIIDIMI